MSLLLLFQGIPPQVVNPTLLDGGAFAPLAAVPVAGLPGSPNVPINQIAVVGTIAPATVTNLVRNADGTGFAPGTPGPVPSNWTFANGGLTRQAVATGVENGLTYTEWDFSGTATGNVTIDIERWNQQPGVQGQNFTYQQFLKLSGGSWAGVNSLQYTLFEGDTTPTQVAVQTFTQTRFPTGDALGNQLYAVTRTLTDSRTRFILGRTVFNITAGAVVHFRVRVAGTMMTQQPVATPYIPSASATVQSSRTGTIFGVLSYITSIRQLLRPAAIAPTTNFGTLQTKQFEHATGFRANVQFGQPQVTTRTSVYVLLNMATPSWSQAEKPRLLSMQFGDGYIQSMPDGLTPVGRVLTLTWDGLDQIDMQRLIALFRQNAGHPISFQAPREPGPRQWLCKTWNLNNPYPNSDNLTAQFEDRLYEGPLFLHA